MVALTQSFCNACGGDLDSHLQKRRQVLQASLREAVQATKEHRYEVAISLLSCQIETPDHRLRELQAQATTAIQKIATLQANIESASIKNMAKAEVAYHNRRYTQCVKLLSSIPSNLLTDAAEHRLGESRRFVQEDQALQTELQLVLSNKDWMSAGSLVGRLLEMHPEKEIYLRLATQIGDRIIALAEKQIVAGKYAAVASYLFQLPEICRSKKANGLVDEVQRIVWLAQQISNQPLATPTLGRVALRLQALAPQFSNIGDCVDELKKLIGKSSAGDRCPLQPWHVANRSVLGGDWSLLGYPKSFDWSAVSKTDASLYRLNVAIGLAISGLGLGRINGNLMPAGKGLMSSLRRRNRNICWGIDIGSMGIRAVQIQRTESKLSIEQVVVKQWLPGELKMMNRHERLNHIRENVKEIAGEVRFGDDNVWVNLSSTDTISHFLRLPPVAAKQADKLLDAEVKRRVPIDASEVQTVIWRSQASGESSDGIAALIVAARKQAVAQYTDLLRSAGLNVSGVTSQGIAMSNFADIEFAIELAAIESGACDGKSDARLGDSSRCIAVMDCGAQTTNLLVTSPSDIWFGDFESGSDAITTLIAKATQKTHDDAEQFKFDPSRIEKPAEAWSEVDALFSSWQSSLIRLFGEAQRFNKNWRAPMLWCTGGGCRVQNFFRDFVQKDG